MRENMYTCFLTYWFPWIFFIMHIFENTSMLLLIGGSALLDLF